VSDFPNLPEQDPYIPEDPPAHHETSALELVHPPAESSYQAPPSDYPQNFYPDETPQLFKDHFMPDMRPQERIPNLGHLGILVLLALCGLFGAGLFAGLAVHFHLFGIANLQQAATDIHYTLGTEGLFYVLTFAASLVVFPLLWHKGFFAGLQWRGATALHLRGRLVSAAAICFVLAMINSMLLPGPTDAPIDRIFRMPGAAWLLFGFGVTLAPFFEELAFRGFLLPALATAFDWIGEKSHHEQRPSAMDHALHDRGRRHHQHPFRAHPRRSDRLVHRPFSSPRLRQPRTLLGAPQHPLPSRQRPRPRLLQLPSLHPDVPRHQRLQTPRQDVNSRYFPAT
jgi:membrane protease YdiL (CAAX protease family)